MAEENKRIVRRFLEEVWNQARLDLADDLVHPSYEIDTGSGPEAVKRNVRAFRTAFPDLHDTIEQIIAEDDVVVARITRRGTHLGTFRDVYVATGRPIEFSEICIWRIEDGKLREGWFAAEALKLRQQIGVLPEDFR